jgi:RES domain
MQFHRLDGFFYRIVTQDRADQALAPAIHPEGRFHHDAQPALYVSPRPDWAEHAIRTYVRDDDPPRVICELRLKGTKLLDLRNPTHCALADIDQSLAAVPWLPERARGLPASTWSVSDPARASGADGMIYTARSEPSRWHIVLFNWETASLTGRLLPYPSGFENWGAPAPVQP